MIGDQVTVTVVRIAGGMVRIGIEAPPSFSIVRRELLDSAQSVAQGTQSGASGRVASAGGTSATGDKSP